MALSLAPAPPAAVWRKALQGRPAGPVRQTAGKRVAVTAPVGPLIAAKAGQGRVVAKSTEPKRASFRTEAAGSGVAAPDAGARGQITTEDVSQLRAELLRRVAGLDRGLAAGQSNAQEVESVVQQIESKAAPVDLAKHPEQADGLWRLVYTSAFQTGSLGGQRPGPQVGRLPFRIGQIFQRIDVSKKELDNVVTLQIQAPWPFPSGDLKAVLAHTFEVFGKNGIRITFEKTSVQGEGNLPTFNIPQLPSFFRPPSGLRSGEFNVVYLDNELRVTRGDRGELRVFVKA